MRPVHVLVGGRSGSGKSEAELVELIKAAVGGRTAIIVEDPHGGLAQDFLLHLSERHLLHRVLYDGFSDTDLIPGYEFLSSSTNPDPYQRLAENDGVMRWFAALLVRRGGAKDTSQTQIIEQGIFNAIRLFQYQDQPVPLNWLANLYTPNSTVFDHMVRHCTDTDTRLQFERIPFLNPATRAYETSPADRRFRSILMQPAFMLRCSGATFDFDEFLKNKGILILDGSDCNADAVSVMMSSITLKAIAFCKKYKSCPVQISMDEANNFSLIGLQESQALAEVRKFNLMFRILVQVLNFPVPEITQNVLMNTSLHRWFAQQSPEAAALVAEDIGKRIVDSMRVHHTETRIRQADGGFEKVGNSAHSVTKDKKGHVISKTHNHTTSIVRKTHEVEEKQDRYMSLADQVVLVQQKLMQMEPGWRWDSGDLAPHYEPMETHLWHHLSGILDGPISEEAIRKLKEAKLQKAIAQVKSSSAYRKPFVIPPPSPPSPPPPGPKKPTPRRR